MQGQGLVRLSVDTNSQLLELFFLTAPRTHILFIHQHFVSKPNYNLSYPLLIRTDPCQGFARGTGTLLGTCLCELCKGYFVFAFTVGIDELGKKIPKKLSLQIHGKHFAES